MEHLQTGIHSALDPSYTLHVVVYVLKDQLKVQKQKQNHRLKKLKKKKTKKNEEIKMVGKKLDFVLSRTPNLISMFCKN